MLDGIRVRAKRDWHYDQWVVLDVARYRKESPEGCDVVELLTQDGDAMVWKRVEAFEFFPHASLTLTSSTAQELINSLWECGLRPAQGAGSAGAMDAVQRHLEDMRTLVFKPEMAKNPGQTGRTY